MKKLGFTLIELLTAIAIVAIVAAIVFGAVIKAVASAKDAGCISNLKQIGMALSLYSADNNDAWPPYPFVHNTYKIEPTETEFKANLAAYKLSEANWWCPLDTHRGTSFQKEVPIGSNFLNSSYVGCFTLCPFGSNVGTPVPGARQTSLLAIHPGICPDPSSVPAFQDGEFLDGWDPSSQLITAHGAETNELFLDSHVRVEHINRDGTES